jgi:hypothetical protein
MAKPNSCSALIGNNCKNGFRVTAPCHGVCVDVPPICMKEDVCARLYAETGGAPKVIAESLGNKRDFV